MTDRPAAIVVAEAPRPGACKTRLEPLLGPEGCAALQAALIRRAVAWAEDVGDAYVAYAPADAVDEFASLAPRATLVEQVGGDVGTRLAAATELVLEQHGGPVVVVGVDTPQLDARHATAALDDLRDGIDVTVGPANHGGYYLIGLREPHPEVFALPAEQWGGPETLSLTLGAIHEAGLTVGMLRSERLLEEPQDAAALLADPVAPEEIRALLRAA